MLCERFSSPFGASRQTVVVGISCHEVESELTPHDLDALCIDNIARFKRPREYKFVEALPKNNYGKVLKTELRKLVHLTP